jgi:hypothetical protein
MVQSAGDWWLLTGTPNRDAVVRELTDLLWGAYPEAALGGLARRTSPGTRRGGH